MVIRGQVKKKTRTEESDGGVKRSSDRPTKEEVGKERSLYKAQRGRNTSDRNLKKSQKKEPGRTDSGLNEGSKRG